MIFYDMLIYIFVFYFFSLLCLVFNSVGNLFFFLIFIEISMLSLILTCVCTSLLLDDSRCLVYALVLIVIAAVESAVGLSLILVYQRLNGHIFFNYKGNE